jgi:hypothetical protein
MGLVGGAAITPFRMGGIVAGNNNWLWTLSFWAYVMIKVWGTLFAAWSWWWLLLPFVPELYAIFAKAGIL